ncbi:MAG: hypothetical protein FD145_1339 [Candidatus Saganbacteria bacterium]|uniref:Methyltransferase type 11 domain-containing protein n=1 Tax=Candidatus Saganbacteria bacterium TaxID=2575572 RepID=A0A833L0A9_UNCSA|nr:MAG: hypothetical protein FD145_1339 [Candidatus Saganbacteria bacterium]
MPRQYELSSVYYFSRAIKNVEICGDAPACLEIGPGNGHLFAQIIQQLNEKGIKQYHAVDAFADIDPWTVGKAKTYGIEIIRHRVSSVELPRQLDGKIAFVWSIFSTFFEEPHKVLENIRRVLSPGGIAYIVDIHPNDPFQVAAVKHILAINALCEALNLNDEISKEDWNAVLPILRQFGCFEGFLKIEALAAPRTILEDMERVFRGNIEEALALVYPPENPFNYCGWENCIRLLGGLEIIFSLYSDEGGHPTVLFLRKDKTVSFQNY